MTARDNFFKHYQEQLSLSNAEFKEFEAVLDTPLPTSFWVSASYPNKQFIDETITKIKQGSNDIGVKKLSWTTDFDAWVLNASRKELRKAQDIQDFHSFVVQSTDAGYIWRQEEVSMLPSFLLNISRGDKVLDMCAAPGSKTAQLLAILAKQNEAESHRGVDDSGTLRQLLYDKDAGFVVANEVNLKRLDMLVFRIKRMRSFFPYALFTSHDASNFPEVYWDNLLGDGEYREIKFDKILCDVPCTGDGTIRKNPNVLKTWSEANSYSLNPLQFKIALKAAKLLEVGGTMVYSTCSFNPIENEAVVFHLMKACDGALDLLDPMRYAFLSYSRGLHTFRVREGLTTWKVDDRQMKKSYVRAQSNQVEWNDTFSPPASIEENLRKTIRIYPHDQNTGGFFIAVLRKRANIPSVMNVHPFKISKMMSVSQGNYASISAPMADEILEFYQLDKALSSFSEGHMISRCKASTIDSKQCSLGKGEISSTIGFVSRSVKNFISTSGQNLKIENAGLRLFVRDTTCSHSVQPWRICNEAADLVFSALMQNELSYKNQGKAEAVLASMERFVCLRISTAVDLLKAPRTLLSINEIRYSMSAKDAQKLEIMRPGGIILYVEKPKGYVTFSGTLLPHSIQALVSKADLDNMIKVLERCSIIPFQLENKLQR